MIVVTIRIHLEWGFFFLEGKKERGKIDGILIVRTYDCVIIALKKR